MKKPKIILFVLLTAALWGAPYKAAAQIFAVRANALAACGATLNAGAEAALTDNWSLELSGYWNPVQTASLSMNFHAVQLGGRYWFYESFVGHFLGQHLTYVGYDLGSRTKRYKGHACGHANCAHCHTYAIHSTDSDQHPKPESFRYSESPQPVYHQ